MNRIIKTGVIIFLLCTLFSFSQTWPSLKKINKTLSLTKVQKQKTAHLLQIQKKQATNDRRLLKNKPIALIEAAKRRRATTMMGISELLTPEQRKEFRKIKVMNPGEKELFQVKEGLALDKEQTFHIRKIIRYYNNLMIVKMEEMREIRDEFRQYAKGNPGSRARRGGQRIKKYASSKFKELNKKKRKDIKTHLSKKQKKQYKKIIKMQKKQMEEKLEKRRERRNRH